MPNIIFLECTYIVQQQANYLAFAYLLVPYLIAFEFTLISDFSFGRFGLGISACGSIPIFLILEFISSYKIQI